MSDKTGKEELQGGASTAPPASPAQDKPQTQNRSGVSVAKADTIVYDKDGRRHEFKAGDEIPAKLQGLV